MSPERRAEVVALLLLHQVEWREDGRRPVECLCEHPLPDVGAPSAENGWKGDRGAPTLEEQIAEHQLDMLVAAGFELFRVDAVVPSSP